MNRTEQNESRLLCAALAAGCAWCLVMAPAGLAQAVSTDSTGVPAHWSTQKIEFTYTGFTSRYSCDGIEDKVRDILRTFGAGKDIKVKAIGCDYGASQVRPNDFTKVAWVTAEFTSLVPGADTPGTGTVKADWAKVQLMPGRPNYMGTGECELIDSMRPLLEKGFSLRNVEYRVDCVPRHVTVADYRVQAETLRLAPN